MAEPVYEVMWPLGRSVYEIIPLASRSADLNGKTVCELWDWLFKGDQIFSIVRDVLSKRYPGIRFVDYSVFGNTHSSAAAALPDLLRKHGCDAVVSAIGH